MGMSIVPVSINVMSTYAVDDVAFGKEPIETARSRERRDRYPARLKPPRKVPPVFRRFYVIYVFHDISHLAPEEMNILMLMLSLGELFLGTHGILKNVRHEIAHPLRGAEKILPIRLQGGLVSQETVDSALNRSIYVRYRLSRVTPVYCS